MLDDPQKQRWMQQALTLARRGSGYAAPNPLVGAVLVKDNRVIGKGFHRRFGQAHAEINAIRDAQERHVNPQGATLYVTLEPCCHHGKTPPCTQAIKQAGVIHVEAAMADPNPLVAGKGLAWLGQQGITTACGLCEGQAKRLNLGFIKHHTQHLPQVILKWAQSLDGCLAYPPDSPQRWISNEAARRDTHRLRSYFGAIMAGIGTIQHDNPLLTVRLPGKHPQPLRVILDTHLQIDPASQIVQTAQDYPTLIFCGESTFETEKEKVHRLNQIGCEITPCHKGQPGLDLLTLLHELNKRNILDVLVEGGPTLLQAFLQQNLADQAFIYIAPKFLGPAAKRLNAPFPTGNLLEMTIHPCDDNVRIHGYFKAINDYC